MEAGVIVLHIYWIYHIVASFNAFVTFTRNIHHCCYVYVTYYNLCRDFITYISAIFDLFHLLLRSV